MKKEHRNNKPLMIAWALFTVLFCLSPTTEAVVGIPDQVPAATLLVPFFEVGVSSGEGTLLVIANQGHTDSVLHATIWDRDGNIQASQNITLNNHSEWHISVSAWLDALEVLTPGIKASLQVGDFYWGYITFDSVTTASLLNPYDSGYPFAANNDFTGWIYYIDLLEGKTNGLCMVPIEAVASCVNAGRQKGFYDGTHDTSREKIDGPARRYAHTLTTGETYSSTTYVEMFGRFFQQEAFQGATRMVIWRYLPADHGATSIDCDNAYIKSETGDVVTPTIALDHVVNVIDIGEFATATDFPAGWVYLLMQQNNTTHPTEHQIYGFTINSASYQASLNWMAIFEMQIYAH